MCPSNENGRSWRRLTARLRGGCTIILLSLAMAMPTVALAVETHVGKRKLGVALASSATEHMAGREVSTPRSPEALLLMFLINPRFNAYVLKNPEVMPSLMDRVTEPGFAVAVYQSALQPTAYLHFIDGWTDAEKLRSYFEVMDPRVILAWARALSHPGYYAELVAPMADQRKVLAWAAFLLGSRMPDFVGPPLDYRTYLNWLTLPVNPDLTGHLAGPLRMANPAQWVAMLGTMMVSTRQALQRFAAQGEAGEGWGVNDNRPWAGGVSVGP